MVAIKSVAAVAALSLFNTAQAWYNDLPSCLSPFEPFVYTGCYDNGQPGQKEALSLRSDLDSQNMTVEICVAHCKGNDYRLAGLSYYGVCYCGETVSTALLAEDQCSFPCSGNSSETCGGDSEINIWMDPTFPPLKDQTDTSEYASVGCWTDDSSDGKALFYRQDNLDSSTLTTEKCLQSCLTGGFPFAGTEYGGECYCGVVVGNGTNLATDSSTCNMPCNGNSTQTCGGPSRLSLYVAKDLQSLEPCGTPPNTSSTITTSSVTSTTSSVTSITYPVSSTTSSVISTTSSTTSITYPVSSSTSSVTSTKYPVSSTTYPVSSTTSSVTSATYPVSSTTSSTITTSSVSSTKTPVTSATYPVSSTTSSTITTSSVSSTKTPVTSATYPVSSTTSSTTTTTTSSVSSTKTSATSATYPVSSTTSSVSSTKTPVTSITYPVSSTTSSVTSTKSSVTSATYPVSTTKYPVSSTTTTSAPVCTTTTVTPPTCEYKVGKWCSNPIPDWHDNKGCLQSWSQCTLQSTSCFLNAGFPDSLQCLDYSGWCSNLNLYCLTSCLLGSCDGKSAFIKKSPPKSGGYPTTQTSTYPCPTTIKTTTTKTTTTTTAGYPTSSCPVATPTGICVQPTNWQYGYAPGKPVGGIDLPIVTCNNIKDDYNSGNVFKLYTDQDSNKCPSYPRPQCPNACQDACKTQYQQCESVYAEGCRSGSFNQRYGDADAACKAQYNDCLTVNKNVKGNGQCTTWSDGCSY